MDRLLIGWIAAAVVFALIEAATAQILTLWFCIGSIGAILANVCGASVTVQVIGFTRTKVQPTNLDMCVGQPALVTETIDNLAEKGQAKIRGNLWTARSADGSVIESGKTVTVVRIEGVKLIVAPAKE